MLGCPVTTDKVPAAMLQRSFQPAVEAKMPDGHRRRIRKVAHAKQAIDRPRHRRVDNLVAQVCRAVAPQEVVRVLRALRPLDKEKIREGARALGLPATSFTLLWVESKSPHCVRAQTLKDEDLARGHALNELAAKTFWECYRSGVWPGPGDDRPDAEYVDLPDWYRKSVDDRVKFELREAA
ncbi:hypothetical protein [Bradyrhizobium diazoefficiens]|uniref:hypothetical protein n=1 Tax=Bradyrhizobium diazoefficiens TaxID=1355477 RepID=UPI00272A2195|nr:hypothetical protein [Bradyrhizobium diazoefficiens]WLA65488.1 hypothetical protein QNN01_00890 [Bradyrhizobium diazoefficiens]